MAMRKLIRDKGARTIQEDQEYELEAAQIKARESLYDQSNLGQTSCKPSADHSANLVQTSCKPSANHSAKRPQIKESSCKPSAQPSADHKAIIVQSSCKPSAKTEISSLVGLQKFLLETLFQYCVQSAELITPPLPSESLARMAKSTIYSARNALQRLEQKQFIRKHSFKDGRGGWTKYELLKDAYDALLKSELYSNHRANLVQSSCKPSAQPSAQPSATAPSSSSNYIYINKRTTTTSDDLWELVQTPQLLKDLGFGKNHIDQIKSKFALSPEEVSKSLEAFAFDLANGELERLKTKNINPINYLFGAIKQGGYCPVNENFKTAEELAEEEMIERLRKNREAKHKRAEELRELLFEQWLESKTAEELCSIAKPVGEVLGQFHKVDLKSYFLETEFERMYQESSIQ